MLRRSPLRRRTPLRPGATKPGRATAPATRTPLRRLVRVRPVNPERRARLHAEQFSTHADFIRSLPCAVPGCGCRPVDPAHVRSRGAGGKACDQVPLCAGPVGHHAEQHRLGIDSFQARHNLDLPALAAHLWTTSLANRRS
jgi:hypothetical protein